MQNARKRKIPILVSFAIAIGAIILLAGSLSQLELAPGKTISQTPERPGFGGSSSNSSTETEDITITIIKYLVLILLPLSIIYVIISPTARKRLFRDVAIIASVLLALFLFANAFQNQNMNTDELAQSQNQGAEPESSESLIPGDFITNPPQWLTFSVSFLIIAILIAIGLWVLFRLRGQQLSNSRHEGALDSIVQEAHEALEELRSGANLKNTVIRCYHDMCQTLRKERGIQRQRAMTAREFEGYLARAGVRSEHIQRLTKLFEGVRYGDQSGNPKIEHEAQLCLEAIVKGYTRPAT